jgi:hypothetical protein
MIKYFFIFIAFIHGLIHFMGFAKSFGYGDFSQLNNQISKPIGIAWLIAGLLFVISSIFYISDKDFWTYIALLAVALSQVLIVMNWQDTKFGTIPNLIILAVSIISIFQIKL